MKKRLLSALLALALVFVLLPTTALAGETTYSDSEITISGKYWNFGNKDTSGKYAPVYFQSNGTAFQESKPTGSNYLEIKKTGEKEITIKVHGTVDLTEGENSKNSCISVNSMHMNKRNLIITGAAKGSTLNLTCKNNMEPLYSYEGSITISGGVTVNAKSQYNKNNNRSVYGIYVSDHDLIISDANTTVNVESKAAYPTVKVDGTITVSDGAQLNATNKYYGSNSSNNTDKAYAIKCGQLSISDNNTNSDNNTKVTAKTSNGKQAISGTVYNLTENDDYKLTFKAGMNEGDPFFNDPKPMDKALGYKYVEITQAPTDPYVFIAGEPAIMGQETPIPGGSGTYLYVDAGYDGNILTLKDATINKTSNKDTNAIKFTDAGTYTVNLEGTNKISNVSTGISAASANPNFTGNINVILSGSGSLDITAGHYAINMQTVGNLKFENTGTIKLTTGYKYPASTCNALHVAGNVTIDKTKYDIVGVKQDIEGTRENISDNPNLDTILKGTSTNEALYFKSITITPAAAKPSTIRYNGTTLKQGETIYGETSGTATVDSKNNTITLKNFNGTAALSFDATLADSTLVLEGTNTLSSIVTTQKGLTISGSGSLTVGSIRVPNNTTTSNSPSLTIDGAKVTAGTPTSTTRAVEVKGDLTVTNGSLTATSKSDSVPTVQVGGNATFTGSTVTITNNSTTEGSYGVDSNAASSALHVNGAIDISGGEVTATATAGGDAIRAVGNITVSNGAQVTAKNNAKHFSTITAGQASGGVVSTAANLIVSGEGTKIHAQNNNADSHNLGYGGAIYAKIKNANESNYLNITGCDPVAPNDEHRFKRGTDITITRGDEVTRTNSPVVIAGTTLRNDTYYTITNGSKVAEGTEDNYNAFYNSTTKTLKLNNAKISTTTNNAAIEIRGDLAITVTGTNELKGNYNHCIESWSKFTINGPGTLEMTNGSNTAASVIYCSNGNRLTIDAEVIIKNEARPGNLIFTVTDNAYSFAEGYNVYASTDVSGSPLETYDAAKSSTYKYLRVTKENLAPTTPTTYTVTITAGDNMKCESGALTQEVTKGAAITEVKFMAASGHYFPADYVSKMNLPAELTAEIRENSWYLIISGTPTSDVTINLPAASVRPTITVSMPTPAAGNTPATASDITLTYSDINKSISKNLTISNVVWQSYVSNGDGSITLGEILSNGDKFVEGTKYRVTINFEGVSEDYAIVPAAGTTAWSNAEWGPRTMTLHFDVTGAACTHEYTNDWHANGNTHWHECKLCRAHADEVAHTFGDWITDTPATDTTDGSKHRTCSVCQYQENATIPKTGTGEIVPPTPDNPGTIVIIRPAEEEKPAQQPNPSTGANDLVGLAVAAAVAAALGSAALLRKHD